MKKGLLNGWKHKLHVPWYLHSLNTGFLVTVTKQTDRCALIKITATGHPNVRLWLFLCSI